MKLGVFIQKGKDVSSIPSLNLEGVVVVQRDTQEDREFRKTIDNDVIPVQPYFILDKKVEFDPRHFIMQNKQVVWLSDEVLILGDPKEDGALGFAKSYAEKTGKKVTILP